MDIYIYIHHTLIQWGIYLGLPTIKTSMSFLQGEFGYMTLNSKPTSTDPCESGFQEQYGLQLNKKVLFMIFQV